MVNYEWQGVTKNCGGGGRIGRVLADELRARGHEVTVVTDEADKHYLTFPARSYRRLSKTVRKVDPDVLHGQFAVPSSVLLPRLSRKYDVPLVVSVMGADVYDPTRYDLIRPLTDRAVNSVLQCADAVVAPSRDMQRRVHEKYNETCLKQWYGLPPDEWQWRPRTPSSRLQVLTVSRLVERKNLLLAHRTLAEARGAGLDLEWTVVGTGPLEERLGKRAGVCDWMHLTGYVEDLQPVFDDADVFFLPSKHEAFGVVFLEALAAGLPVVTSDHGGQTDIVGPEVGRLAPQECPGALAGAVAEVAENYRDYQRATEGYVEEHFSAHRMAAGYEELFNEVAA
jgi:glycosyltransferase involved in cell wall biosynthesis